MNARSIEDAAERCEFLLPTDVVFEIDESEDLRGRGLYGYAWPDGAKVTLYPDAFDSEEQLFRTLVHELVHVRQFRAEGAPKDSVTAQARELAAYAEEDQQWQLCRERQ